MNQFGVRSLSFVKNIGVAVLFTALFTTCGYGQLAGTPGAFSRIGFGARGMGMGNSLTAVRSGELNGYYNPAVIPFQRVRDISISYGILSLDRYHNSLFFTQPLDTNAAVSLSVLNSGVKEIDGRDIDGFHTENYSTSENLFSLSFGLRIRKIAVGLTTKIIYNSLFKDLSSTSVGFDVGFLLPLSERFTVAAAIKDINSKYSWETSSLYGQLGNSTTEKFPVRKIVGISYLVDESSALLSGELEMTNRSVTIVRFGGEAALSEYLSVRAGIDGWNTTDSQQAHPSFGLTVKSGLTHFTPALNYAYVVEPYGLFVIHVVSLSVVL